MRKEPLKSCLTECLSVANLPDAQGVQTDIQNFAKSIAYAIFTRSGYNRINILCECQFLRQSHRRLRSAHFYKLMIFNLQGYVPF